MPYCPQCRAEYREGFTECADCHVALVPELPPAPPDEVDPVETEMVMNLPDPVTAMELQAKLESDGIPVWVRSFDTTYLDGVTVNIAGTWGRLWVRKEHAARARELIDQWLAEGGAAPDADTTDSDASDDDA
jgi:hypothetical protein